MLAGSSCSAPAHLRSGLVGAARDAGVFGGDVVLLGQIGAKVGYGE